MPANERLGFWLTVFFGATTFIDSEIGPQRNEIGRKKDGPPNMAAQDAASPRLERPLAENQKRRHFRPMNAPNWRDAAFCDSERRATAGGISATKPGDPKPIRPDVWK